MGDFTVLYSQIGAIVGVDLNLANSRAAIVVEKEVVFNSNRLKVVAGSTKTITPSFAFTNNDRMLCYKPDGTIVLGTGFSFSVNVGDIVYFVPESGNWDNLIRIDFSNDDFVFDLSDLAGKINELLRLNIFRCYSVTGDLSDITSVQRSVVISDCVHITGNYSSLSQLTVTFDAFNCELLEGDLSSFSQVSNSLNLQNCVNTTGDTSSIIANYYVNIAYCSNITGLIDDFSQVTYYVRINGCPLIGGNLAALANSNLVYCLLTGSNVLNYTSIVIFKPLRIYWYDLVTPPPASDLNQLIADITSVGKLDGTLSISGTNLAITDSTALANIATLQTRGWTVIYNS